MRKAVLSCLLSYIGGILAFELLPASASLFAAIFVLLAVLFRYTLFWRNARKLPIFVVCFFLIGLFYTGISISLRTDAFLPHIGETVTVTGRIVAVSDTEDEYYDRYELKTERMEIGKDENKTEIAARETVELSLAKYDLETAPEPYAYGDVIIVVLELEEPSVPLNDGDADYTLYKKARGIFFNGVGSYGDSTLTGHEISYFSLTDLANLCQQYFIDVINTYFSGDEAGLLRGMLLSDKTGFSDEFYQKLTDTGMVHITVASGLHVNCVLAVLLWILFACRVRKRYAYPAAIVVLWAFAFLQGMTPSIVRAVVMTSIFLVGELLSRDYDRKNTLYLTAFVMLLYDPFTIFSVGFQLSFGAVLGIILFAAPIDNALVRVVRFRKLSSLISVSIAAQLLILPVLAFYFNKISVYSVLANLLIVPVLTVTLGLGFLLFAVSGFGPAVGSVVAFVLGLFVKYILGVIHVVSILPFSTVDIFTMNIWKMLVYYLLLAALYFVLMKKGRRTVFTTLGLSTTLVVCLLVTGAYTGSLLRVTFLNVGQGDAALIQIPGGKTVVIDGGGSSPVSKTDLGETLFVPYLKRNGVNTIDYAILSHYNKDHAQGIAAAVRTMEVKNLILPYRKNGEDMEYKEEIERTAREKGVNILYFKEGDRLDIGDTHFVAFAPTQRNAENRAFSENNKSLVLKLTYGETSFLFTGDIELEAESKVANYGDAIRADVLKVAHHGSKTSSTAKFIKTCAPKYAIISEGKDNVYGFPARETINTLVKNEVDIYQTSECGDIRFYVDAEEIKWIDTFYERPSYEETFLKSGASIWLKNPQPAD